MATGERPLLEKLKWSEARLQDTVSTVEARSVALRGNLYPTRYEAWALYHKARERHAKDYEADAERADTLIRKSPVVWFNQRAEIDRLMIESLDSADTEEALAFARAEWQEAQERKEDKAFIGNGFTRFGASIDLSLIAIANSAVAPQVSDRSREEKKAFYNRSITSTEKMLTPALFARYENLQNPELQAQLKVARAIIALEHRHQVYLEGNTVLKDMRAAQKNMSQQALVTLGVATVEQGRDIVYTEEIPLPDLTIAV